MYWLATCQREFQFIGRPLGGRKGQKSRCLVNSYTVAVVVFTTIPNVSGWTGELGLSVVLTKFGGCAARDCGYDRARDCVGRLRVRRGDSGHRRDAGCSG